MKRALIIVEKVAPLGIGTGKEHINSNLIKTHIDLGYQVNVIVTGQKASEIHEVVQDLGAVLLVQSNKIYKYKLPLKLQLIDLFFRFSGESSRGKEWLNTAIEDANINKTFHIVVSSLYNSDMPAWVAASLKTLNFTNIAINWEHRSHYASRKNTIKSKILFLMRKWMFSYCNKIAVVSKPTAHLMQKRLINLPGEPLIIPNPVKDAFFSLVNGTSKKTGDNEYCISTQNFTRPLKGFDILLKSIQIIHSSRNDIKFLLVGKHTANVTNQLERYGISQIVSIKDRVPHDKITGLLANARISIVSSYIETFSNPTAEALACGVPVVATICGGPEDFVRDKIDGRLVPTGDPKALAEAIIEVWDSRERYNPNDLSKHAKNLFGKDSWSKYWVDCYSSIN